MRFGCRVRAFGEDRATGHLFIVEATTIQNAAIKFAERLDDVEKLDDHEFEIEVCELRDSFRVAVKKEVRLVATEGSVIE